MNLSERLPSRMRFRFSGGFRLAVCFWLAATTPILAAPLRVLILSGQNNHAWQETTPKLESILKATGIFEVAITDHPENCDGKKLREYDVLLSNWNSFGQGGVKEWPEAARAGFLDFVRNGKGLVVVHAGGSSFPEWGEYQDLVGGGWGQKTGHGPPHRFTVDIVASDNPITRGMPPFKTTDELWHRMSVRPNKTVLATAFSAADRGGSGKVEPVAFVTEFGKGRSFNLVLGHDVAAMSSPGLQALLVRGTEWAATGNVTLPTPSHEAAEDYDGLLARVGSAQPETSRALLLDIEKEVAAAAEKQELRTALARKLAERLSANEPPHAVQFYCRQLSLVGSEDQVPALALLLGDTNFSYYARLALERIPGEAPGAALRDALARSAGLQKAGIIQSLAVLSNPKAIPQLAAIAAAQERDSASAAVSALGRIGGPEALQALLELKRAMPATTPSGLGEAILNCAARLAATGQVDRATPVLRQLLENTESSPVRAAAFQVLVSAPGQNATAELLSALNGKDDVLRNAAIQALKRAPDSSLETLAGRLQELPPGAVVGALAALADRKTAGARARVEELVKGTNLEVRLASIAALGVLGNGSTVECLTAALEQATAAESAAITTAVAKLPGDDVDQALLAKATSGSPATRLVCLRALRTRAVTGALPAFSKAASEEALDLRKEAIRALGELGNERSYAELIQLLDTTPAEASGEIESALVEICRRSGSTSALFAAFSGSSVHTRISLINTLAALGGAQALARVEAELSAQEPELRSTALRLLCDWPDASAAKALAAVIKQPADPKARTLALRGLTRIAPLASGSDAAAAAEAVGATMQSVGLEEKKRLLSVLGEITNSASLKVAASYLADSGLQAEARKSVYDLLQSLGPDSRADARPVVEQMSKTAADPAETGRLQWLMLKFGDLQNLCRTATATNVDGLSPDGQGGPASAAIDSDPTTYWDETDGEKFYGIRVDFKKPGRVAFLRIVGWQHQNYAPRDFEVVGDGKLLRKVESAAYTNNSFHLGLPETTCRTMELRITRAYGPSPAIRELEVYGTPAEE